VEQQAKAPKTAPLQKDQPIVSVGDAIAQAEKKEPENPSDQTAPESE
jgi:hypothetical protein